MPEVDQDLVGVTWMGWPVQLGVALPDVVQVLVDQRRRLADRLQGLSPAGWKQPTRCHLWDVADVISHLTHTNHWVRAMVGHGRDPSSPMPFPDGFDNRVTPHEEVMATRGRPPEELLDDLRSGTRDLAGDLADEIAATAPGTEPAVPFLTGRFRAEVVALHLLWDSILHERDVLLPLGLGCDHTDEELVAFSTYGILFAGLLMGPVEEELTVDARLHDREPRLYRLKLGESIRLDPAPPAEPGASDSHLEGFTLAVVDALAGRGSVAAALTCSPDMQERAVIVASRLLPPT